MDSFYEDSIFWSLYIAESEHKDSLNRGFLQEISDFKKKFHNSTFDLNFNLRAPCTSLSMTLLYPVLILTMPSAKKYMNYSMYIEVA